MEATRSAISIVRDRAFAFTSRGDAFDLTAALVPEFNYAVLYLLWHQFFSIATRAICLPYIPVSDVSPVSGLSNMDDKDSGNGYKIRLVWMRPQLISHMRSMESQIAGLATANNILPPPTPSRLFFLDGPRLAVDITPSRIETLSAEFFPYPANTPRHIMRYLLRESRASHEVIEMYMGHWHVGREPWGRFSSFDLSTYLQDIRIRVNQILDALGFIVPNYRDRDDNGH
jgi:hypothetical protein